MRHSRWMLILLAAVITGCAGIDFHAEKGKGLVYFDPRPYLFVSTSKDCVTTATVVALPGKENEMAFQSGYGSSALSATLSNGIPTTVGQMVDTKVPETITAVSSLATAASGLKSLAEDKKDKQVICKPMAYLLPIKEGIPQNERIELPTPEVIVIGD